jgi:predicted aldo/keto reductase-like oxidoreductase
MSSHLTGKETTKIIDDGKIEGVLLNMHVLNFPYAIDAAFRAKEKGVGVGTMSPLAGGLIPNNQDRLQFLCSENFTPAEEALKFICGLPCVDFSYIAFRSKEEIDNACKIADLSHVVSDAELANIRKNVGAGIEKACTGCYYCMEHCPNNLPIAEYMIYSNLKYLFNLPRDMFESKLAFHKSWFELAKRKAEAKDCVKCGNCEEQCTQHINIIERLEELADIEART